MNLLEILNGQLDDNLLSQLSEHIGAEPEQTSQAANGIFATLLGGLNNNAQKPGGLEMLSSVLDRDHDGSVLDDVFGMVMGGGNQAPEQSRATNGSGILRHILGDQQEVAAQHIGQKSGLDMSQIMKLMPILAPIVMSVLGKSKSQGNLGLGDLAGILLGGTQQAQQQHGGGLGDLLGSVLGGVLGGNAKQQQPVQQEQQAPNILGSILRGVFGK
jgi:hypothetical protein